MADPKVYTGGVPQGGFDAMKTLSTSSEGESSSTPGGPANTPKVVKEGGTGEGKTHSVSDSENFLMDSNYKTSMEAGRPSGSKTVNPDDLSHADSC